MNFYMDDCLLGQGSRIVGEDAEMQKAFEVDTIHLIEYISAISETIYMLKLDIEGAEFDILEHIIESGIYHKIKFIVCETHERFFVDGQKRLKKIQTLIRANKITNIMLDWT